MRRKRISRSQLRADGMVLTAGEDLIGFPARQPMHQGCPILIRTEVNPLARLAPFSLEGEGLGMRVVGVARPE